MHISDCSKIEQIAPASLKAAPANARTHSKQQIGQIVASIKRMGFTSPVLIDEDNVILAGHGRSEAARAIGLSQIPCVRIAGLTAAEKRAYVLADNKIALNAGYDLEILAGELQHLIDIDFEVNLTGFANSEIDKIIVDIDEASTEPDRPEDEHLLADTGDPVTCLGDTWQLGRHRLVCGDAKEQECIAHLVGGELADMVFTDPPYNVRIAGHVSGQGKARHREFVEASGEMSTAQFTTFLAQAFEAIERVCRDGAIVFICMDWRHLGEALAAGHAVFTDLKNLCVWSKTNGGMGTFYRSQHEMVLVWKAGDAAHTNNFGLGDKGRYRTNVWSYAGVNTFKTERMDELGSHPTVKPVALVADAIRDVSNRGQIVLDTFGGSGTTLIAAEKTGRVARLVEIDPAYCDVIVRRWERVTGKSATFGETGESFSDVKEYRLDAAPRTGRETVR